MKVRTNATAPLCHRRGHDGAHGTVEEVRPQGSGRYGWTPPTVLLMAGRAHPGVDAYIERLPEWQQQICRRLREIVRAADPDIEETIKRSVQPYFVLDGNVCALLATKDHVNLFLYDPTVPDPHGIINQGHGNATARAIQVYDGDPIDEPALTELLQAIVANNRAGGWRRLNRTT
jgi:hypothetical protein